MVVGFAALAGAKLTVESLLPITSIDVGIWSDLQIICWCKSSHRSIFSLLVITWFIGYKHFKKYEKKIKVNGKIKEILYLSIVISILIVWY